MTHHRQKKVWSYHQHLNTIRDDLHWLPVRQRVLYKLCSPALVGKCLRRVAPSYLIDSVVYCGIGDNRSIMSIFVLTLWSDNSALSTVTLRITQFRCLRSCNLELSTSSHSRPVFITILFSTAVSRLNYLPGRLMVLTHCSTFVIA